MKMLKLIHYMLSLILLHNVTCRLIVPIPCNETKSIQNAVKICKSIPNILCMASG